MSSDRCVFFFSFLVAIRLSTWFTSLDLHRSAQFFFFLSLFFVLRFNFKTVNIANKIKTRHHTWNQSCSQSYMHNHYSHTANHALDVIIFLSYLIPSVIIVPFSTFAYGCVNIRVCYCLYIRYWVLLFNKIIHVIRWYCFPSILSYANELGMHHFNVVNTPWMPNA